MQTCQVYATWQVSWMKIMRVAIGADHGGYELKNDLVALLKEMGHEVEDAGAHAYDAHDDLEPAIAARPNDPALQLEYGNALVQAGAIAPALAAFDRVIELTPS